MTTDFRKFMVGLAACAALIIGATVWASAAAQQPPKVVSAPCNPISSIEGKDNFEAYCAVCHGKDAKGNGPAAPAMKAPVPDLTTIAARHGKFDPVAMEYIIRGRDKSVGAAHGVEDMPIWGEAFRSGGEAMVTLRINNLVKYLESIQKKPTTN